MSICIKCGAKLSFDEIGIYKKLVHRGATEYLCKSCLSSHFNCDVSQIDEKISYYKKMGCTLFLPEK